MIKNVVPPCIECIVLAVCRNRSEIKCNRFYQYSLEIESNYHINGPDSFDAYWTELRETLPNVSRIVVPEKNL